MTADLLRTIAADDDLMEIGRKAIEDELVEWRDSMRFVIHGNGFTIRNFDSSPSHIIRFGPEIGVQIALKAIAAHLDNAVDPDV